MHGTELQSRVRKRVATAWYTSCYMCTEMHYHTFFTNVWTEWAFLKFLIEVTTRIKLRMSRERRERSSKLPRQQACDACACADACLVCFRFHSDSTVYQHFAANGHVYRFSVYICKELRTSSPNK